MIVPYVRPLRNAQSSMPMIRGVVVTGVSNCRVSLIIVAGLVCIASFLANLTPASPPVARPI